MLDAVASMSHYEAHLVPVWDALPDEVRGAFVRGKPTASDHTALVASFTDHARARKAGYRRFVVMEHGAGQSYSNTSPFYAGGWGRQDAGLFLTPNEHAAARWRSAYPRAKVEVVGSPRLDDLPARLPDGKVTVAISFHFECGVSPEARSALRHYRSALPELARSVDLIGHGHPRADLGPMYAALGIEYVPSFDDVCRRADLYVCDNSSTLFEFASTGRPVVVLNAPWYRESVDHGLRFWDAATVGINVNDPGDLVEGVRVALDDCFRLFREEALDTVYAYRTGAAQRAADAITGWLQ